uniref:Serine/threonine-protein kinase CTR1 n=1 Tax=Noccaea caerulescens TaxID=107243 RepID=A0A1J3JTQ3_NOCCA
MCNKRAGDQKQKDSNFNSNNQIGRRFAMDSGSMNSSSVTSPVSSLNDEPHRVKFLCSFLGSILPRPQDGKLRYVGGETRIVSVTRDIRYEELMSKMRELYDGAAVLKYQQPDEDLDALVSVVNDDDVTNMMEEYDKLGSGDGFTRLRIFLFSSPEQDGSSHYVERDDQRESERRYVDALNNLTEGTDFRKLQQHPDSPRFNLMDNFSMMEPMLNQLSIETGGGSQRGNEIPVAQYSNLHQLRIPRVGSGQMLAPRYGEVEGTWSPYYSPRHHGHHDSRTFQEFPSSPSSARYRMPYGEIPDKGFDRMPEDYVRPSQASHHPFYEHQAQVPDNVVWVPAGAMPPESKGGFPGNVLHGGQGGYEGGNVCENCRVPYHRNHQPFEQPNNGFSPVPSAHCAYCPPNRDNFLLNADPKPPTPHGAYQNETFGHERGWMVQQQVNSNPTRIEEGRPHISNVGRPSDHYTLDGPGMNYPLGHRAGPENFNEATPLNSSNPSAEERGFRYGNNLYAPGPETVHSASHSHIHPQQNIWQNVPNHIAGAPGLPMQVNGTVNQTVIRNPIDSAPRYSIGVENQNVLVGSPQNISGFDGMSSSGQPCYPNPHLQGRAFPLDPNWVPSENPTVLNEYQQVLEPLSGTLLQTNLNAAPIAQTPGYVEVVRPVESNVSQGGEQFNYVDAGVTEGVPYLNKSQPLAEGKNDMGNLVEVSPSAALPEGEELSVERLSFLPELMESVKRAALEGAAEVKAHPEEADHTVRPELVENESVHVNAQVEPEMDSDSDNSNSFKIEPTKAEAEALSRGLQTIRNDDLEEIRELGSGTYGSVYHGKWKGSDVAIKRIKASCFAGKPSERERLIVDFWKEALLLSSLHHPNVVSFYGIVRDGPDGSLATVAEFMVNGSLKQFLQKKDRTIDRRKRLIIGMDTAFGMEYLHGKNIVHFDLKCENLLVNMRDPQRPICKIGDLGLSKVKQKTLVSGGVRGTLPWMAPELLSGKSNMVSEKIDVYSFGIVMWELLTGEEPYADMHCASIIGGIVNNALRPKIPQWCDPEWKGLMESCWASEPTERPSFAEISQKLRTMAAAMNLK